MVQIAVRMGEVRIDRNVEADPPRKDRFDIKDRIIEHGYLSDFESGCVVLQKLGLLQPLNPDDTPHEDENAWTACYRMKVSLPELRERLAEGPPDSAPVLSAVIQTFLGLTTDYGYGPLISTRRDPFAVPTEFERSFELFARCGYVEPLGDTVKWTARIAPAMRAIYAWTDDDLSREELYDAEIERMWRTMPPRFREVFFSGGPVDVVSLSAAISHFWDGEKWLETPLYADEGKITLQGGAIGKAKALAKKFHNPKSS